jgi:alkyldihydroxyacetonephosphate synthase
MNLATKHLSDFRRIHPDLITSESAADRLAYGRDLWPRHHLTVRDSAAGAAALPQPGLIVWPRTTAEVVRIVAFARDTRTPIVPFGAGSGVCAAVLPSPESIVLDMKRMNAERAFSSDDPSIVIEAGAMGVPFEESLERRGFTLGHFPSSILCSTVGGWLAARSAGQCSGRYGKIEDMVLELECVTGTGELLVAKMRAAGPSLVPLFVGSEGTLGVITAATLRLHHAPTLRKFSAFTFPSTKSGWEALRCLFQNGLRPAVARLYDPFDAMLARQGSVKNSGIGHDTPKSANATTLARKSRSPVPGIGGRVLRTLVGQPRLMNGIIDGLGTRLLGPAQLILIFEGPDAAGDDARASELLNRSGTAVGEAPATKWFGHRYSVSYRQAPVFMNNMFSDTIEVASTWDNLEALYNAVRRALGNHVFVMAHLSHAYPDGCCIYFSFAGVSKSGPEHIHTTYDSAWQTALAAAEEAGGTIAHHHGVGRSKAPLLSKELGVSGTKVGI